MSSSCSTSLPSAPHSSVEVPSPQGLTADQSAAGAAVRGTTKSRGGHATLDALRALGKQTQKALKATGKTVATPFYSTTWVEPRRARPKPKLDRLLTPDADAGRPRSLGRKHERNIASLPLNASAESKAKPAHENIQAGLPANLLTAHGMPEYVKRQWKQIETAGRFIEADVDALVAALQQLASARVAAGVDPADAFAKAVMVSHALAQASDSDPARARHALQALRGDGAAADPAVQADALRLQIVLGKSGVGLDTLLQIAPHLIGPRVAEAGSEAAEIQRDAFRHALRAAGHLLQRQPLPGLTSLEQLADLADTNLPAAQRTRTVEPNPAGSARDGTHWRIDPRDTLTAKALVAALTLKADPRAELPPHLADAYLAWRNGFSKEGPGTELERTRERSFKLFKYVERAASYGKLGRVLSGLAGKKKSPLIALQAFGTRGALFGHPDDQFAAFTTALGSVKQRLRDALLGNTMPQRERALCAARLAALDHWEQRMAASGLREHTRLGRAERDTIAVRARALMSSGPVIGVAGEAVDDADRQPSRARNVALIREQVDGLKRLTPAHLESWAREAWALADAPVPTEVEQHLGRFRQWFDRDVRTHGDGTDAQFTALEELIRTMPDTYDMRFTGGGSYGVASVPAESLAALSSKAAIPALVALPDGGYLKGRHAVMDIGSSEHFGHLFIGSDARTSRYGGIGAFAGWTVGGKKHDVATIGVSGGVRFGRTSGGARGVSIRVRRSESERIGGPPDAWRSRLVDVLATARTCGPAGGPPRNADELWSGLARKFAKDPAVSINWTENRNETGYVSGSASATARFGTPRTRVGPAFSAALTSSATRNRIDDKTGSLAVNAATNSRGLSATVSATLVETLPGAELPHGGVPAHERGRVAALGFPTVPYVGIGTTLVVNNTAAALRVGRDGDRVAARLSFKDTEFGTFEEFKQYVDHYRPRFVSGQGGGEEAQRKLDEMLTLVGHGHAGNVITGERRYMADHAGKRLDFLYKLRGHHETQPASSARAAELAKIDAEIAQTLGDDSSWRRPTLYVLEALAAQRTAGLSFMLNAQSTQSVSGVRELSVLVPTSS